MRRILLGPAPARQYQYSSYTYPQDIPPKLDIKRDKLFLEMLSYARDDLVRKLPLISNANLQQPELVSNHRMNTVL